jgi:hypothetical protein
MGVAKFRIEAVSLTSCTAGDGHLPFYVKTSNIAWLGHTMLLWAVAPLKGAPLCSVNVLFTVFPLDLSPSDFRVCHTLCLLTDFCFRSCFG